MRSYVEIRLAKFPCSGRVKEGRQLLRCSDVYRSVTYTSEGKIKRMRCLLHGHVVRGNSRVLSNGQKPLGKRRL